ncbi:MAG: homoserine kinase [Proteobacteria bacterium]|nr:homoserine kinase [Pseudomonadota bacterium]
MAVYTELTEQQIGDLLSAYKLGDLQSFRGASDGIENTTYFLSLDSGAELVLTLFESLSKDALLFYIELTSALHNKGLPVPCPLRDKLDCALQTLAAKPVLIFPRVAGEHLRQPGIEEVRKMAVVLGKIHQHSLSLSLQHPNPQGLEWMQRTWAIVSSSLSEQENQMLAEQLRLKEKHLALDLPRAVIHGDLFRDNVLFFDGEISGVIDFYSAGTDSLLLDMAIAVNDWCTDAEGLVNAEKRSAFIHAYESQRRLSSEEHEYWQQAQQLAATCFWLSRQHQQVQVWQGAEQVLKDPEPCKRLLLQHLDRL